MFEAAYLGLWLVYGVSVLLAFALLWRFTRWQNMAGSIGRLIRLLYLVLMLTPAYLSAAPDFIAPASIVMLFDFFQGYEEGAFDAAVNLVVATLGALTIYLFYRLIVTFIHFRRTRRKIG